MTLTTCLLIACSFILVDATPNLPDQPTKQPKPEGTDSQGLPPSRDALLGALLPGLDPSQHTLLAMIQVGTHR